jgi:hypothetical protein
VELAKTKAEPSTLIRISSNMVCTATSTDTEFLSVYSPLAAL